MARPRVFVSSTFYDLKQVRAELERFIREMGYDPVLNERGSIPYGSDDALETYCYQEVNLCDIVIAVVGGRYGSASVLQDASISQVELKTAHKLHKQVYVFVERHVLAEYQTYQLNRDSEVIKYRHVDNIKVFRFLDELALLPSNNTTHQFELASDITAFLREQWAGLFQRLLQVQANDGQLRAATSIESSAKTLDELVRYLVDRQEDEFIDRVVLANHPVFARMRSIFGVGHPLTFHSLDELRSLLRAYGYHTVDADFWGVPDSSDYVFRRNTKGGNELVLRVSCKLFDAEGRIRTLGPGEWTDEMVVRSSESPPPDDDIPF